MRERKAPRLTGFDSGGSTGLAQTLLFVLIGLLATVVLQSTHAVLMLVLAALAGGQLQLEQSLAIAIGSNVGSSVSTAFVGMFGSNRSGQRLALFHVLFNVTTAGLALLLLVPLTWTTTTLATLAGFGDNTLLQLALFHTLINVGGVALFWPGQQRLAGLLVKWLPDRTDPQVPATTAGTAAIERVRAHHLGGSALESVDAAAAAVVLELRHLRTLCLEVICQALYLPADLYRQAHPDPAWLLARPHGDAGHDVDPLYQQRVKGVYGDLLAFLGRLQTPQDPEHQQFWINSRMAALQLVNAVKDAKHLQKNLGARLRGDDSPLRTAYVELRRNLFEQIVALRDIARARRETAEWRERLAVLDRQVQAQQAAGRERLFELVGDGTIDGLQAGSLLNDQVYAERIYDNLRQSLVHAREPGSLRRLRQWVHDEAAAGSGPA